jgi:hypothetical protein
MYRRISVLIAAAVLVVAGATAGMAGAVGAASTDAGSDDTSAVSTDSAALTHVASVNMTNQTSGGTTVTVDEVYLSGGGFVTIHDASLNEGGAEVLSSVRGSSAYLSPGNHSNVTITLDDPVENTSTLVAMPHKDTDGDRIYDTVSQGGFVTIHDDTVGDGPLDSVVGTSDYLDSGTSENVEIAVDTEPGQHFAMPHVDSNGNEAYDFVSSEGQADAPYVTAEGDILLDGAEISAPMMDGTPTETGMGDDEDGGDGDDTGTPGTETDGQPGFDAVIAVFAPLGAVLLACRS